MSNSYKAAFRVQFVSKTYAGHEIAVSRCVLASMKTLLSCGIVVALAAMQPVRSTTLEQLSLDDMIQKSTAIVRGKLQPTTAGYHGSIIYSHYQLNVAEVWKGSVGSSLDVAVPGGLVNGIRETYSGAPSLVSGQDYVLFLWTSKSGLTQVIGLSQGLFNVVTNAAGATIVSRSASAEPMLNGSGQPVADSDFQMPLTQMRTLVQNAVRGRSTP